MSGEKAAAQPNTEAAPKAVNTLVDGGNPQTAEPAKAEPEAQAEPKAADPAEPASGEKPPESEGKGPEEEKKVAPEAYDLKLPEGTRLDASRVEALSSYAKEKGLSQEAAQAILDHEHTAFEQLANQNHKVWANELMSDKEFGGQALKENGEIAYKAAEKWFGPEFVDLVRKAQLNNNPLLFKGLVRLGRASQNDTFIRGGSQGEGEKSDADLFYPNMKKET